MLDREQRRASARGTVVFQPAAQQLDLLPVPELRDRAKRNGALAVVARPRGSFDLVVPLGTQVRELALLPLLRERVGLRRRVRQPAHAPTASSDLVAGPTYRAFGL